MDVSIRSNYCRLLVEVEERCCRLCCCHYVAQVLSVTSSKKGSDPLSVTKQNRNNLFERRYLVWNTRRHGTRTNWLYNGNKKPFVPENPLLSISHEGTVTPRYLSLSITDSVTSHRGGVADRGALRRTPGAGDHSDCCARCQVYVPSSS